MHMTQEELAEIMRIPKSTISAYENDKVDIKSSVIMELARNLHATPNYFLGYDHPVSEEDSLVMAISSIIKRIEDKHIRELLVAQMRVAAEMYN